MDIKQDTRWKRITGRILHGGEYNPEQWLDRPDILEKDLEYMKEAGVNTVTLGVFSWSMYEPEEGVYRFEWMDQIMDRMYENGIGVILATPTGAGPVWMDQKYPEVMRVGKKYGVSLSRLCQSHCMNSRVFREKTEKIDTLLAKRYGKHPALLMWHVSNQLGGECRCPVCQERFRGYLRDKYKTIERLNQEWWTTVWSRPFQDFSQINPPSAQDEERIHGRSLDWKRFVTWSMKDYMESEIRILREITPDVPVTTNFMSLYPGLDYHRMIDGLDIISWNSYPAWDNDYEPLTETFFQTAFEHAVMRSMKRDRPFLLMESAPSQVSWHSINKAKKPGIHRLSSIQAIACGSDSVLYFQWRKGRGAYEQCHGAVIDHLGTNTTRVFRDVRDMGEALKAMECICGTVSKTEVAVIFDWENRWAIQDMARFSQGRKNYDETVSEIYKILLQNGIDADILPSDADFKGYKVVIAPMLYLLKPQTAKNLDCFVTEGGCLLGTYLTGYVNENTLCYLGGCPGDGLRETFGLYTEEIDCLYPSEENYAGILNGTVETFRIVDYCEILKTENAETKGVYLDDFYKNTPVLTKNFRGKGRAWYLGARLMRDGMASVLKRVCKDADIDWEELPEGLEKHKRYGADRIYTFLLNTTREMLRYNEEDIEPLGIRIIEEVL